MKPFILDFCIPRKSVDTPGFQYDEISNLNVIMTENGKGPFVESDIYILELATKTEVKREEDEPNEETLGSLPSPRIGAEQGQCGIVLVSRIIDKNKSGQRK